MVDLTEEHLIEPSDWKDWVVYQPSLGVVYTSDTKKSCKAYVHSELDDTKNHATRIDSGYYNMCGLDGHEVVCMKIMRPGSFDLEDFKT